MTKWNCYKRGIKVNAILHSSFFSFLFLHWCMVKWIAGCCLIPLQVTSSNFWSTMVFGAGSPIGISIQGDCTRPSLESKRQYRVVILSFSIVSIMVSSTFLMMQRDAMGVKTGMICEATMASWTRKPFRSSERVCFHISHPFTSKVIAVFTFHIVLSFFCLYGRGYQIPVPLLSDHSGLQAMRWPISPCCHPGTGEIAFWYEFHTSFAHIFAYIYFLQIKYNKHVAASM